MALIACPGCGKEISNKAKACPACGYSLTVETPTDTTVITCEECGIALFDNTLTCPNCGCPIKEGKTIGSIPRIEAASEIVKIKKGKNKLLTFLLIIIALIVTASAIYFIGIPEIKYRSAQSNIDKGEYYKAISKYTELESYRESEKKILECYYLLGEKQYKANNLSVALNYYKQAKDYYDAADIAAEIERKISYNYLKDKMRAAYNTCISKRTSLSSDGTSITVDSKNKYDDDSVTDIVMIISTLNMSSSILNSMDQTNALMGRQSAVSGNFRVEWSYHPDNGLDAIFSINQQ